METTEITHETEKLSKEDRILLLQKGVYVSDDNYFLQVDTKQIDTLNSMLCINRPIFVSGERGTGKTTLIKKYVKEKMKKKFVYVSCGTLDPDKAMSLMFGYVKGAFTGAYTNKEGFVHKANGGILYLDEIQDLDKTVQRELINFLDDDEHKFCRVGSTAEETSDFLLICSSNRPLSEIKKLLYDDFYDRISTMQFNVPSIREQRKSNKDFIAQCLSTVWKNYRTKSSNQNFFVNYDYLDNWNIPGKKTIKQKIIFALNEKPLYGNFRDIQKLLANIELYALNEKKINSVGICDKKKINEDIDIAIKKWKADLEARDSISTDDITDELIKNQKWEGMNNMFRYWIAKQAVEIYGSATAASNALEIDKNVIIKSIRKLENNQ